MTSDSFNDLPGPRPPQIERADDATDDVVTTDDVAVGSEFPDEESTRLVDEAADEVRATASEVTDEDLSSQDLLHNEVPPEDIEQDRAGVRDYQADMVEPGQDDTIDERIRQEEPEPGHDVVPRPGDEPDPEQPLSDPEELT